MTSTTPTAPPHLRPYDEACLKDAIVSSRKAAIENGCMPFGAVAADVEGNIVATATNCSVQAKKRGGSGDVTRHAEMELVRKLSLIDKREGCTIYTSTEPCVMCAGAIYWSGVSRVVYGCSSASLEQLSGPGGFDIPIQKLYSMGRPGMRQIEIIGPLLEEEALRVHKESGVWTNANNSNNATTKANTTTDQSNTDIETERSLRTTGLGTAAATRDYEVPVIDMSCNQDLLQKQLWEAAHTVGFFTVTGHGIPQDIINQAFVVSAQFFSQPLEDKQSQSPFSKEVNSGYEYFSQVRPSTGTPDQKESLQITARQGAMDGRWPLQDNNFHQVTHQLLEEAHKLAIRILDLLEPLACPNNKPGTLANSHKLWSHDGQCTLRLLHYPPIIMDHVETVRELTTTAPNNNKEKEEEDGGSNNNIHYWRAGPHTDWCNITLLFQRPGQDGLECCSNPRSSSSSRSSNNNNNNNNTTSKQSWTPVDPVEGGIAINIGDMLMRWSDGKLYSNLHRVRMPISQEECSQSRYSIAFFAQSDKSTIIRNSEGSITAGDYILSRIRSNFK